MPRTGLTALELARTFSVDSIQTRQYLHITPSFLSFACICQCQRHKFMTIMAIVIIPIMSLRPQTRK